ncbi:MAG: NACHT domain-containing protein, partial [Proteobacteria bacterium]
MQTTSRISLPLEDVYVAVAVKRLVDSSGPMLAAEVGSDRARQAIRKQIDKQQLSTELSESLREQSRLVLLGDPGAGKTTILRFLTLQFARAVKVGAERVEDPEERDYGPAKIPVFIRVAEYASVFSKATHTSIRDFICSFCCRDIGIAEREWRMLVENSFNAGTVSVFIDGLDEVVSSSERNEIARKIDTFAASVPSGNRIVVTSRVAGYRESPLSGAFTVCEVLDLTQDQIHEFLDRWCLVYEKHCNPNGDPNSLMLRAHNESEALTSSIDKSEGVRRLAVNPLLLTILALIHRNGAHIPRRRIEVYRMATATLLRDWQIGRGISDDNVFEEDEALELLAPLAYWMHCSEPTGLAAKRDVKDLLIRVSTRTRGLNNRPEAVQLVSKFLRRVEQVTGVFVERTPDRYGFMHLTFEEYLAAQYIVDADDEVTIERINKLKHHPRWEEPIRLAVANERPKRAAKIIREAILIDSEQLHIVQARDVLLSARCLGDCNAVGELVLLSNDVGVMLLNMWADNWVSMVASY